MLDRVLNRFYGVETWEGFFVWDLEAVIKLAASAASRKTKSRAPRCCREAPGRRLGKRPAAGQSAFLDLGPLDLVVLDAALAADLIMASISLHVPTPTNPILDPAV